MNNPIPDQSSLSHQDTIRLIIDFIHRTVMHHVLWYGQVQEHFGREEALSILKTVYDKSYDIQVKRLSRVLGFELTDGLPGPMTSMSEEELRALKEGLAVNWLANDGVWFQVVEFAYGMKDAKRCNDKCWDQFSPVEAWSVKKFLNLSDHPGLEGLKQALNFRLYATINVQSITDENPGSFIFRMNDCRVQSARKRKGLEDYPCKSGGLVEYTTFAEAIDPRIKTECIGCPPDVHPQQWYCAWRFSLNNDY
ncbi:MAG: DUF6125 family protein [Bacteroidales bacterium]|nr:hypothetical protein [Lentimicrobiaceae bacterium]MDD5694454.1 DUF6125 family protein [Bacteroidales bacterium]